MYRFKLLYLKIDERKKGQKYIFFYNKFLGRGLGSTQSKGGAPNSWSIEVCLCGLWSMTSKPILSVHTGRLLTASLSYGDASPSAAMETQQSVTPQDRTRDAVVNPTLIVQSLRHWTHGRWVMRVKLLQSILRVYIIFDPEFWIFI